MAFNFCGVELPNPFFLAPMAGVTNRSYRTIALELGAGLVFTEMVSAAGLARGDRKTVRLLPSPAEAPRVGLQLFGGRPEDMRAAALVVNGLAVPFIDVNFGCPARKIVRAGCGVAIMREPARVRATLEAVCSVANKPVLAKIRAGWDEGERNAVVIARVDYSVPVRWAHHPIGVKGYWPEVVLLAQGEAVARHARIWAEEQVRFEPLHYLALLERKPGALDHARPLAGWTLPECFGVLRRRLEAERQGEGIREYIRVLRLLEQHALVAVREAVERALRVGAITRDVIAQFLLPREDWRLTRFCLDGHPHLRGVHVDPPDIQSYRALLGGGR